MIVKYAGYEICISAKSKFFPDKGFTDEYAAEFLNSVMVDRMFLAEAYDNSEDERNKRKANYIREEDDELFQQLKERGFYDR